MRALLFVLTLVIGGAIGFAVAIFAYPFIFLNDVTAMEELEEAVARQLVATGEFIHVDPNDPVHYGKGKVSVYNDVVRLEADFEVGPGPAFHVYLVPETMIRDDDPVENSMFVDLGMLRAFKGAQNYEIPEGINLADYPSVVIFCEYFSVLISTADLQAAA